MHTHTYTLTQTLLFPPTYWYSNSSQAKTDMMLLSISEEPHILGTQESREAGLLGKNYICHFSQEKYLFSLRTSKEMLKISFAGTFWHHSFFFPLQFYPFCLRDTCSVLRYKHSKFFLKEIIFLIKKCPQYHNCAWECTIPIKHCTCPNMVENSEGNKFKLQFNFCFPV